ncbi:succinate dehydrogenase cytochrome b subunit [Nodosilinea sp. E11]|uniref:succinate dehydrogenase cytochrome b subunit n=1 Tax=Nodosilinea sp. E11 TaxID=3037479 RepID=UPI00293530AA|nr:succinate dehydrogenase cytochrome b subunit [Nodosilinea sp. E11]WOD41973.1 succinate dehydrogenase cytochrome b subunit [Nodosilinea sp. E11]
MTNTLKSPDSTDNPPPTASPLLRFYRSPLGKKLITGATGLGLAIFVLAHMAGNLVLFISRDAYNAYAHLIETLGFAFYALELLLLAVVLLHASVGIEIFVRRRQARPQGYSTYQSVGNPSYQTLSSRTMIVTGAVLAVFLLFHLHNFKFGIYYPTQLGGQTVRDLARLVIEDFHRLPYVVGYTTVMVLLASHLRHGLWSALQSIGLLNARVRPVVYGASALVGAGIAVGFIVLPWAIYLGLVR